MLLVAWKFLSVQQHKRLSGVDSKRSSDHSLISWLLLATVDESEVLCTPGGTHKRETFYRTMTPPQGIAITGQRWVEPMAVVGWGNDCFEREATAGYAKSKDRK